MRVQPDLRCLRSVLHCCTAHSVLALDCYELIPEQSIELCVITGCTATNCPCRCVKVRLSQAASFTMLYHLHKSYFQQLLQIDATRVHVEFAHRQA